MPDRCQYIQEINTSPLSKHMPDVLTGSSFGSIFGSGTIFRIGLNQQDRNNLWREQTQIGQTSVVWLFVIVRLSRLNNVVVNPLMSLNSKFILPVPMRSGKWSEENLDYEWQPSLLIPELCFLSYSVRKDLKINLQCIRQCFALSLTLNEPSTASFGDLAGV